LWAGRGKALTGWSLGSIKHRSVKGWIFALYIMQSATERSFRLDFNLASSPKLRMSFHQESNSIATGCC